jgi:hypothetical protein
MDAAKIRAWWWARQGLDGSFADKTAAEVLAGTGWARSVGGSGPYLGLFARAGLAREAVDADVAKLAIHELPSARGCTCIIPASDFALALKVGEAFGFEPEMKVARKLGVTDREVDKLCAAVLDALAKGALDPDALREATGGAARSLGEEGKKKGLTTTLPLALGKLQTEGEIRRVPINGRLDQQRYRYVRWEPNPLRGFSLSPQEAQTELARRFFAWTGPATQAEFQWFSALSAKAAKAALEPLKLEPIAAGDEPLMLPAEREKLEALHAPKQPQFALVASADGIFLLRRNLASLLDRADADKNIAGEKGAVGAGSVTDLPNHGILDRGRLVGVWEYDTATESIVSLSFIGKSAGLTKAVKQTEEYVRMQLGDARSMSLDSPKSRIPRIERLRALGGK